MHTGAYKTGSPNTGEPDSSVTIYVAPRIRTEPTQGHDPKWDIRKDYQYGESSTKARNAIWIAYRNAVLAGEIPDEPIGDI